MTRKRIFLYVQHLLGIGHLRRAATLARACTAVGLEVTLASGGLGVPGSIPAGVLSVQLPPVSAADVSFKHLVDEDGAPIDELWKERRREALLAAWRAAEYDALVLELFPFGRRPMRFELLPLLDAASSAKPRPLIVSSVRDVLSGGLRKPERDAETLALLERYFDHVLVHSDPGLIEFGRSFGPAERLMSKLHYTGYVVEPAPARSSHDPSRVGEVLVSAGGGAVGQRLLETAVRARPLSALAGHRWRVLAGVNTGAGDFATLEALVAEIGDGKVVLERARTDFTRLLSQCAVSVSQAGYNTVTEALQAGARAVVVPFAGGAETEQGLRARKFAERGLLEVVEDGALTAHALAAAIDRAAHRARPEAGSVDLGGAARSAVLLESWTRGRAR